MSTLLKKVTSAMTVGAVLASTLGVSIVAAASGFLPYAEALADAKVITKSSNEAGYRLADNALRQEVAGMMMALNKATYADDFACANKFSDVSATKPNSWICKVVETALSKGLISANAKFRPEDKITRAEALAMILKGQGVAITTGAAASFNDTPIAWQKDVANSALAAKIVSANASFRPNDNVTRGELFVMAANAAGLKIASDDLNLDDLFGDDTSTGTTVSTGTTSTGTSTIPTTPVVVKAGDLNVSLNPASPASATLPSSAEGVKIAVYDLSSGSADVSVNAITLKRAGIGANVTVSRVALFANGVRASNDKTFNSSSDEATISFTKPLVLKAGSTVSIVVVGEMGAAGANNEFTIQLVRVDSSAINVNGTFPMSANTMKVSSTVASALVLSNDGTVSDVKLGQTGVEVFKFKAKNNSSNSEDMNVSSITLKEDGTIDESTELANVKLYADGTEVASVEKVDSKYVTFNLKSPLFVKSGKTINFVVRADVTGGAGDYIRFYMDKDLDVSATGTKNGYISITNSIDSTTLGSAYDVDVLAGALSIVTIEPTITELRKDKDDNVLGTFKITSNAGKSLELQKFKTTITEVAAVGGIAGAAGSVAAAVYALENVELYNPATQETFDLDCAASGKDAICSSTSLNIALANGSTTELQLRADTTNNNLAGYKLRASASNIGTASAADFYVVETADDKQVTDITPSSITFKTLEVKTSSVTVNTLSMSTSKSAVVGSKDVSMLEFEVKADSTSAVTIDEVKVEGTVSDVKVAVVNTQIASATQKQITHVIPMTVSNTTAYTIVIGGVTRTYTSDGTATLQEIVEGLAAAAGAFVDSAAGAIVVTEDDTKVILTGSANVATFTATATPTDAVGTFDKTRVTKIALYKDSISDTNLLKSKSASDISSNVVTFDSFKTTVAKSATQKFIVVVDFIDDSNQAYDTLKLSLTSLSANDDENDDITTGTVNGASKTLATINNAASARTATIKGAGSLSTVVYTSESPLNNVQNVLGNTTSNVVAAFELTALNEAVKIKDLHIVDTSLGTLKNGVKNVILLKSDKTTEIARKSVSSDDVFFDDINYTTSEGTEKIYVKIEALKIGKDEAGAATTGLKLKLQITDAEGNSSSKVVTNPADTSDSTAFNVVPVNVSAVTVAESREGSTFNDGASTVVAKVKLTTETTSNTKSSDGATLKTKIEKLRFKVSTLTNLTAAGAGQFTIKRINPLDGTSNSVVATRVGGVANVAAGDLIEFDLTGAGFGTNDEISSEATYEISTTEVVTTKTSNAYLELQFIPSTTGGEEPVLFGDNDAGTGLSAILLDTIKFGQLKYNGN